MHNRVNWDDYYYFLRVARLGSLNAASKALKVNHTTVLRRINALEKNLGVRLFERFKSGYELTANGQQIFDHLEHIEGDFLSVERKVAGKDVKYEGTIKLSTTDTLGQHWLPPHIRKFNGLYPDILLDIDVRNSHTDLTKREADIVIAAVNRHPEYMIGKMLGPIQIRLYASHEYVEQHGLPQTTRDLADHSILLLNEQIGKIGFNEWLKKAVPRSAINLKCNMLTSLHRYVLQGLGIAPLPTYIGDRDNRLVIVHEVPEKYYGDIWMLTHPDLKNTGRIRAFMQFMYKECSSRQ